MKFCRFGIVVAVASLALSGCTGDPEPTPAQGKSTQVNDKAKDFKVGLVFDSGGRGDKSFNDSAYRGLERAQKELGVQIKTVDSRNASDYELNMASLAQNGYNLVFAIGFNQAAALSKVAPKYPDVHFAIVDEEVKGPNIRSLKFKEEEGSFLAGYLAGLMTKTNKIGFVGGEQLPVIKRFEVGYIAGAKTANPSIEVLPAKYTDSWNDPGLAQTAAMVLYGQGADIIYHASGRSGKGVFNAAKETSKYAIGVDSDQDWIEPGLVLTSMIKRVDEAVFSTIKDSLQGSFTGDLKVYDLKSNGVGLSQMEFTRDKIGQEKLDKIEVIKGQILSGDVKVPSNDQELQAFTSKMKKV